jgi:hypothetical protein
MSFCEIFKLNLSDFDKATVKDFLEQLNYYKEFHEKLSEQMKSEFNINLQDKDLRDFVVNNFKRFIPIQIFVRKNAKSKKIKNTTSTEKIENPKSEDSQMGDFSMTIDGY